VKGSDIAVLAGLILGFAVLVTAHLCIVVGLARRQPRWRSLVALVIAPLAPYWALRDRMYVRGASWLLAAIGYVVARVLAT